VLRQRRRLVDRASRGQPQLELRYYSGRVLTDPDLAGNAIVELAGFLIARRERARASTDRFPPKPRPLRSSTRRSALAKPPHHAFPAHDPLHHRQHWGSFPIST
jgi:hypothetical protein